MIAFCFPTIPERATMLGQAVASVNYISGAQIYVRYNSPSCGEGWQETGSFAFADGAEYIALLADDVAWRNGSAGVWFAADALRYRKLPAPYLVDAQGQPSLATPYMAGNPVTNVPFPFLNRELWEAVQPIPPFGHYCDVWITEKAIEAGYTPTLVPGYRLVHKIISDERPGEHEAYLAWKGRQ